MKKSLLALALLSVTSIAFATPPRGAPAQPTGFLNQVNLNQQQAAVGLGYGQGGNGGAVNSVISTSYDDFPVNSAFATPGFTTAPCKTGYGVGAQGVKIGIAFSGSTDDLECDTRMWAASWMAMGQPEAAVEIACTSEMNKKLSICQPAKNKEEAPIAE